MRVERERKEGMREQKRGMQKMVDLFLGYQ